MATHAKFVNIFIRQCECIKRDWSRLEFENGNCMTMQYERERVSAVCPDCERVASSFCRKPKLESASTKADKRLIGSTVNVKRIVAWVGYAKNTHTVFWSDADESAMMSEILIDATGINSDKARVVLGRHDPVYWLRRATRREARYLLFRNAFRSAPLHERGLWFSDTKMDVMISGVASCQTGSYFPGSSGGSGFAWDSYEPPSLYATGHHQLYYGYAKSGERALIYPGDCVGSMQ